MGGGGEAGTDCFGFGAKPLITLVKLESDIIIVPTGW